MADAVISMDHVYKKFVLGEQHDSLRDLIPALFRRLPRGAEPGLGPRDFWALDDISFEISKGEAVGIIGHNGAGKSTLLKHLSGVLQPTRGKVLTKGRLAALIEVGAGFHQDLTGRENVFLNGVILGMTRKEIQRKFDDIVEFAGLATFIDTPVKRYSSGMYARLGFSVAAHMEPEILIIDEVLSVGDATFQSRGVEKMRSVLRSGTTVIFVSHNLRAVADLCPRSLLLKKGQLVQDGPTSAVIRTYMSQISSARAAETTREVSVESVQVLGEDGPRFDFSAGQKTCIRVNLVASSRVENLSCFILLQDDKYYDVFYTDSEILGVPTFTMEAGARRSVEFELQLHLATGSYHLIAEVGRGDTSHSYDRTGPVATILVNAAPGVMGCANLYPRAAFV